MVNYSERLKAAMTLRSVNTSQLATAMKISYQAVKKVIDGKTSAFGSLNNLTAARYLSVDSDWLADGTSIEVKEGLCGLPCAASDAPQSPEPIQAKQLSALALELAYTFDELTDRSVRNRAYSAATNEIFKQAQQESCASPNSSPSKSGQEEAQHA